eukprot:5268602-Amphidinium_carterae.2
MWQTIEEPLTNGTKGPLTSSRVTADMGGEHPNGSHYEICRVTFTCVETNSYTLHADMRLSEFEHGRSSWRTIRFHTCPFAQAQKPHEAQL